MTYVVAARFNHRVPRRDSAVTSVEFDLGGGLPIDDIKHVREFARPCFIQAFSSNGTQADDLPIKAGARVRVTFDAYDRHDAIVGSVWTWTHLTAARADYSVRPLQRAVGC